MNKQGTIVRWDAERGFGFVRSPATDGDVFFHVRDYRGGRTNPAEGLAVSYEEIHVGGKGPRAMAVQPLAAAVAQRRAATREQPEPAAGQRRAARHSGRHCARRQSERGTPTIMARISNHISHEYF